MAIPQSDDCPHLHVFWLRLGYGRTNSKVERWNAGRVLLLPFASPASLTIASPSSHRFQIHRVFAQDQAAKPSQHVGAIGLVDACGFHDRGVSGTPTSSGWFVLFVPCGQAPVFRRRRANCGAESALEVRLVAVACKQPDERKRGVCSCKQPRRQMDTRGGDNVAQGPAGFRQPPLKRPKAEPCRVGNIGRPAASRRCSELFRKHSPHMGIAYTSPRNIDGGNWPVVRWRRSIRRRRKSLPGDPPDMGPGGWCGRFSE